MERKNRPGSLHDFGGGHPARFPNAIQPAVSTITSDGLKITIDIGLPEFVHSSNDSEPSETKNSFPIDHFEEAVNISETPADPGCVMEDRERFRRNIIAASFAMFGNEPVLLTFVQNSDCVASYSKTGNGLHRLRKLFTGFRSEAQVDAAGFFNNTFILD